jgi:hypothetical protein
MHGWKFVQNVLTAKIVELIGDPALQDHLPRGTVAAPLDQLVQPNVLLRREVYANLHGLLPRAPTFVLLWLFFHSQYVGYVIRGW